MISKHWGIVRFQAELSIFLWKYSSSLGGQGGWELGTETLQQFKPLSQSQFY